MEHIGVRYGKLRTAAAQTGRESRESACRAEHRRAMGESSDRAALHAAAATEKTRENWPSNFYRATVMKKHYVNGRFTFEVVNDMPPIQITLMAFRYLPLLWD